MKSNYFTTCLLCGLLLFLLNNVAYTQVGIGTTTPSSQLHVNVTGNLSDGITIENAAFSTQMLSEIAGANTNSTFNNTLPSGQYLFKFAGNERYRLTSNGLYPTVNAPNNVVTNALDIGRFNLHFRRVYTQAIHTNDNSVNGGLRINIGSSGGTQSDYNFSDFALYPELSIAKDLGRNGNFWRNFFFVNAFTPSDERLKSGIKSLSYNLGTLLKLNAFEYTYRFDEEKKKHFGFMAQQLQELVPELVHKGDNPEGSLSVNYLEIIPILVKGIQEQQKIIVKQQAQIDAILQKMEVASVTEE